MTAVRDVIETVAKALADTPQRVSVTETDHRGTTLIEVSGSAEVRPFIRRLAMGRRDLLSSLHGRVSTQRAL